jgi:hypothetical protein
MTREEKETIINYDEEHKTASVYTHNAALIRKLKGYGIEPTKEFTVNGKVVAMQFNVPKKWVKVNKPRTLSDKQKAASRNNIATYNAQSKS